MEGEIGHGLPNDPWTRAPQPPRCELGEWLLSSGIRCGGHLIVHEGIDRKVDRSID